MTWLWRHTAGGSGSIARLIRAYTISISSSRACTKESVSRLDTQIQPSEALEQHTACSGKVPANTNRSCELADKGCKERHYERHIEAAAQVQRHQERSGIGAARWALCMGLR